jgi:hypothetical protein
MDLIDLAQDSDHWVALVNTVMNLWVPQNAEDVLEWLHNWRLLKVHSSP